MLNIAMALGALAALVWMLRAVAADALEWAADVVPDWALGRVRALQLLVEDGPRVLVEEVRFRLGA